MLEFKTGQLEAKADLSKHEFEGYASVFGNKDDGGDIVEQGAFKDSLTIRGKRVKVLWQHNVYMPIGKPKTLEEDSKGLKFHARVSRTAVGNDTMILINDGVIEEMSIGFRTTKDSYDTESSTRHILKAELWEISPVTWGMNALTEITGSKSVADLQMTLKAFGALPDIEGAILNTENHQLARNALAALEALCKSLPSSDNQKVVTEESMTGGDLDLTTLIESAKGISDLREEVGFMAELQAFSKGLREATMT